MFDQVVKIVEKLIETLRVHTEELRKNTFAVERMTEQVQKKNNGV